MLAGLALFIVGCSKSPTAPADSETPLSKDTTIQTAAIRFSTNLGIAFQRVPLFGKYYWISTREITNEQFDSLMGVSSASGSTATAPKALNWFDAARFADTLSRIMRDSLTNNWRQSHSGRSDSARLDTLIPKLDPGFNFTCRYSAYPSNPQTVQTFRTKYGAFVCLADTPAITLDTLTAFNRLIKDTVRPADSMTVVTVRTCSLGYSNGYPEALRDSLLAVALDAGPDSVAVTGGLSRMLLPYTSSMLSVLKDTALLHAADTCAIQFFRHKYAEGTGPFSNLPGAITHAVPSGAACDTHAVNVDTARFPGLYLIFKYLPDPDTLRNHFTRVYAHPDTVKSVSGTDTVTLWVRQNDDAQYGFRLPSDSEWVAIAACGASLRYSTSTGGLSPAVAVYAASTASSTGSKPDNPFGIYDMTGNLAEWTESWWTDNHAYELTGRGINNPMGLPLYVPWKVAKGGSYADSANSQALTVTGSESASPYTDNNGTIGFRVLIPDTTLWQYFRN